LEHAENELQEVKVKYETEKANNTEDWASAIKEAKVLRGT
jgi:hypothetical protein